MEKGKKGNGNGNGRQSWTVEEVNILIDTNEKLHGTKSLTEIFKAIVGELKLRGFHRTETSVKLKYNDLKNNRGYTNGDGKKNSWTKEEVKTLKQFLKEGTPRKKIYEHFLKMIPLRSSESVRNKIRHLDKKFVEELIEQIKAYDKEEQKRWQEIYDLLTDETKPVKLKL